MQPATMNNMPDDQEKRCKDETSAHQIPVLKRWKRWFLVALYMIFLLVGQATGIILGRFYYEQGGNSKWMITLVQTAGFPLLFIPFFLLPSSENPPSTSSTSPSAKFLAIVYFILGLLLAGETTFFSHGLSYLSASTYSLLCATQLVFVAVFSYFINSQKFNALILNSVVVLSLSAALVAVNDDSEGLKGVSREKHIIGFICTLAASAIASLFLSLTQLSFQKVLRRENFSVVLEMQINTQLVAACASVIGLFASGEWRSLRREMEHFDMGGFSYVMTLVWTAIAWQLCSVGVVGLIFVVSSLFSNVISTLSLAVTPIASVIVFHDKINGVKIIAMLLAIWGSASYIYQNYLDDSKARRTQVDSTKSRHDSLC